VPWVDLVANGTFGRPKIPVVMHQFSEASICEGPRETLKPVVIYSREAIGH
jgi:hypothetical protein